jgi:hypothetical protein
MNSELVGPAAVLFETDATTVPFKVSVVQLAASATLPCSALQARTNNICLLISTSPDNKDLGFTGRSQPLQENPPRFPEQRPREDVASHDHFRFFPPLLTYLMQASLIADCSTICKSWSLPLTYYDYDLKADST